jgi:hypothetical protein
MVPGSRCRLCPCTASGIPRHEPPETAKRSAATTTPARERSGHDQAAEQAQITSVPQQLRRRRHASWRLSPLESGQHDPWHDYPADWSPRELASWSVAMAHLHAVGLPGQLSPSVQTALRRHRSYTSGRDEAA